MRLVRNSSLLSAAAVLSLAAMSAAQGSSQLPDLSTASTVPTTTAKTTANTAKTTTSNTSNTSRSPSAVITGGTTATTSAGSVPAITGTTATDDGALPTGLPKLSGAVQPVTISVPPTSNAPFMQTSNLPDGTVFIAVGAILGFMAMSVLLWRGLVAWSLHRSVKRAALAQNMTDSKALFRTPAPPGGFYKYSDRDSTISLSGLGGKGGKKGGRPTTASGAASTANLFFSPTAQGAGLTNPGNRGSNYLPSGYYAAGSAVAGNGQQHVPLGGGHGQSISLSNLGPQSQGYSRARSMGPSPPDSPAFAAGDRGHMASSSTLNLTQGYGGNERAPSAYLEDLIDGENPPPMPGHNGHSRTNSGSPHRF